MMHPSIVGDPLTFHRSPTNVPLAQDSKVKTIAVLNQSLLENELHVFHIYGNNKTFATFELNNNTMYGH